MKRSPPWFGSRRPSSARTRRVASARPCTRTEPRRQAGISCTPAGFPLAKTVWRRTFAQVDVERGVAVRLHGGVQDITHLRDLEATYLSARKMEAMALLAGGIAHDFANLVTGLDGFRDSIALSLPEDHSCQADLAQMGDLLRSATGLSRQLLALARRQVREAGRGLAQRADSPICARCCSGWSETWS